MKLTKKTLIIGSIVILSLLCVGVSSNAIKYGGFSQAIQIAQPFTITKTGGGASATSTDFFGGIFPRDNAIFDVGTSTKMWRNAYFSGTFNSANVVVSGSIAPSANNTVTLGTPTASWAGVFASGTSQFAGAVFQNTTTTGVAEQGSLVSSPDAGLIPLAITRIGNNATGTIQGWSIGFEGFTRVFAVTCLSAGSGTCVASSTKVEINTALSFAAMATSTLMVATTTQFRVNDSYAVYQLIASSTVGITPTAILPAPTADTPPNACARLLGTDDTRTITVVDSATIQLKEDTNFVLGKADFLEVCPSPMLGLWYETNRSNN